MRRLLRNSKTWLLSGAVSVTAALTLGLTGAGCSTDSSTGTDEGCVSTPQFFATNIDGPILAKKCAACHTTTGAAKDTSFVLASSAEAGYLEKNLEIVKGLAQTEKAGKSVLLLKPLGDLEHGGGKQLEEGSTDYQNLVKLVQKFDEGDSCPTNSAQFFGGAQLMSPVATLRKAALTLASRLPTDEETAKVKAGGYAALHEVMQVLLTEEAFFERLRESYNDRFFTDFYMDGGDALDLIQPDMDNPATAYYAPEWYDAIAPRDDNGNVTAMQSDMIKYGATDPPELRELLERRTRKAVAQEPLELIAHIVRNNKPFTEVLTADYTVVNPFSAKAYSVTGVTFTNDADPYEFHEAKVADGSAFPQAGVLTTPVWLSRHPTTATNRNRHRARMVFQDWLGTDILKTAERPLDPTQITDFNPTMNNAACSVCHASLDPIAGAFQNFQHENGDQAVYVGDFQWYLDMRPPGFGKEKIPSGEYQNSLAWLAKEITGDPRFAISVTYQAFRMITGQEPVMAPADTNSPTYKDDFDAYLGQYYTLTAIAEKFKNANYNFKVLAEEIVMSPYFRAENTASTINPNQLKKFGVLGTAHLLTPEQLNRKISAVLGMNWGRTERDSLTSDNEYRLLYGGIDSENVTKRITDPNGIMANVSERMANEMACQFVPAELYIDKGDRQFFKNVELDVEPKDVNGYEVAAAKAQIISQIQVLHEKLLGETLEANDPEIVRTYNLFVDTWSEGKDLISKAGDDKYGAQHLSGACVPQINYRTGAALEAPEGKDDMYSNDRFYTARAWMAVTSYLLSDYKFLYE